MYLCVSNAACVCVCADELERERVRWWWNRQTKNWIWTSIKWSEEERENRKRKTVCMCATSNDKIDENKIDYRRAVQDQERTRQSCIVSFHFFLTLIRKSDFFFSTIFPVLLLFFFSFVRWFVLSIIFLFANKKLLFLFLPPLAPSSFNSPPDLLRAIHSVYVLCSHRVVATATAVVATLLLRNHTLTLFSSSKLETQLYCICTLRSW